MVLTKLRAVAGARRQVGAAQVHKRIVGLLTGNIERKVCAGPGGLWHSNGKSGQVHSTERGGGRRCYT